MNRVNPSRKLSTYYFLFTILCARLFSFSSSAQTCQGSYDQEDLNGGLQIDRPFMCGTGMMEHQMYQDRMAREDKGFFNIEGLDFYGRQGYYQKDEELYYSSHPDTFVLVPNGDIASLEFVGSFLRDKNYLYARGIAQLNVDIKSFEVVLNSPYAKDVNRVYHNESRGGLGSSKNIQVVSTDPESFEMLCDQSSNGDCYYFGKDKEHVYYSGAIIPEADAGSFRLEKSGYSRDSKYVYYNGERLEGSSGRTYKAVSYYYSKDENHVYYFGQIVPEMHGKNFKLLGESGMGSDGVNMCFGALVLENTDPPSFVDLGCGYYKDANNAYSKGLILDGIDSETFEILEWGFTKDKNGVYCDDEIIPDANPNSFEVLGRKYSRDKRHVFYLRTTLEHCDRSSFVSDLSDYNKAEDSKAIYHRGERTLK